MVIVDLQDLEDQARMAAGSISGVVLEPEAMLLIVSEIRRLKVLLSRQDVCLTELRAELAQLRGMLTARVRHGAGSGQGGSQKKARNKVFSMKVNSRNSATQNTTLKA
jgi:Mg-chelatase subunit ChlI